MSTLSLMPWKIHAVLAVVCPIAMVVPAYRVYGFGPPDWPVDGVMSPGFLVFAWLIAAGMVALEVSAVTRHRLSEARWVAVAAHVWLAGVATLPVWFSFFWTEMSPIDLGWVRLAANTYLVLLVGYVLCLLASAASRDRKGVRP